MTNPLRPEALRDFILATINAIGEVSKQEAGDAIDREWALTFREAAAPVAPSAALNKLKALRLTIEHLEGTMADAESAFCGEEVISRNDVLAGIDLFLAACGEWTYLPDPPARAGKPEGDTP